MKSIFNLKLKNNAPCKLVGTLCRAGHWTLQAPWTRGSFPCGCSPWDRDKMQACMMHFNATHSYCGSPAYSQCRVLICIIPYWQIAVYQIHNRGRLSVFHWPHNIKQTYKRMYKNRKMPPVRIKQHRPIYKEMLTQRTVTTDSKSEKEITFSLWKWYWDHASLH